MCEAIPWSNAVAMAIVVLFGALAVLTVSRMKR